MALLCMGTPQISLGSHEIDETKRELARKVGATQLIVEKVEAWMAGFKAVVVPHGEIAHAFGTAGSELFRANPLAAVAVYLSTSGTTSVPKTFDMSYGRLIAGTNRYMADPKENAHFGSAPSSSMPDGVQTVRLLNSCRKRLRWIAPICSLDSLVSICGA